MLPMKRLATCVALWALVVPSMAAGQTTVTVLGLRSAPAEEDVARQMTEALRRAAQAASSPELTYSGRTNDLAQLLVLFDCDGPTPQCLQRIGESLSSNRLVYGLLEPQSGRPDADFQIDLVLFDVETSEDVRTLREVVPRSTNAEGMNALASRFYRALTTRVSQGSLSVRCTVAGAHVFLGDREVGTTGADPLVLRELEPGEVRLRVTHPDFQEFTREVTIAADQLLEVDVAMTQAEEVPPDDDTDLADTEPEPTGDTNDQRSLAWLGWSSLGLGVVLGGLGLWGSLDVYFANTDSVLHTEREHWPSETNVCDQADDGTIRNESGDYTAQDVADRCGRARAWQALQFVMYGLGAAAIGVGIWLLVREVQRRDDDGEGEQAALRLTVDPVVLNGGGALSASLSF
jgi:hypothetical protein